jgi:hypothetical protein
LTFGFGAISKTDAKFVQIIHTSSFRGMQTAVGTVDFFPNGGSRQPGELQTQKMAKD